MNAPPTEDRVWITKGPSPDNHRRLAKDAGLLPHPERGHDLRESPGLLQAPPKRASLGPARGQLPLRPDPAANPQPHEGHPGVPVHSGRPQELRFPPYSAWRVYTDGVSHACIEGQLAFIDTFIIPLNC